MILQQLHQHYQKEKVRPTGDLLSLFNVCTNSLQQVFTLHVLCPQRFIFRDITNIQFHKQSLVLRDEKGRAPGKKKRGSKMGWLTLSETQKNQALKHFSQFEVNKESTLAFASIDASELGTL